MSKNLYKDELINFISPLWYKESTYSTEIRYLNLSSTELLFCFTSESLKLLPFLCSSGLILMWFQCILSAGSSSRDGWPEQLTTWMCIACAACGVWLCQPVSPLTPLLLFSKVLNSALFLNCFFFGFLFVFKIFPCLYSTPISPAATSAPNSDTCSVSPVLQSQSWLGVSPHSPLAIFSLSALTHLAAALVFNLLLGLVTLSSILLLHPAFYHAASIVSGLLYGDFVLKII